MEPSVGLGDHGDFEIIVTLDKGKGGVSGFVGARYPDAQLAFGGIEIDQSDLQHTQPQVRAVLGAR